MFKIQGFYVLYIHGDTHLVMMGMRMGVWVCSHNGGSLLGTTILAENMRVRCDSALAGMVKHALVYSAFNMHRNNPIWLVALGMGALLAMCEEYKRHLAEVREARENYAVDPRCKNHEGRRYLIMKSEKTLIMENVSLKLQNFVQVTFGISNF